jgi:hypothetical protein
MVFLMLVGLLQFVYCVIVGNYVCYIADLILSDTNAFAAF